jgi:hypothetical protein
VSRLLVVASHMLWLPREARESIVVRIARVVDPL